MKPRMLRLALPQRVSFWTAAGLAFLAAASNAAASPLYRVYQGQFRFSPTTLTLVFTVYVVVLLITMVFFGSLSDYVGRRWVIVGGLTAGALACGLFLLAHGVGLLFGARALQGVSVGVLPGAAGAALLDLRPRSGAAPLLSSASLPGGLALGALGASALAQYAPLPTHLVWWLLLGIFLVGILAVLAMPEPGTRHPGAVASLRPHVGVPRAARGAFAVAAPCLAGVWALAGFYLSLGPSLAAQLARSQNLLWGGVLIFLLCGPGAAVAAPLDKVRPTLVMLGGCVALITGALVTFASIATSTPAILLLGTAIAGLGFGPAFMGGYRTILALAQSDERAALITAILILSNLAMAIPAVIAGIATTHYGLHNTALVYSLAVAALVAVSFFLRIHDISSSKRRT
jgi:predicted MFS family arabinose efflux permease